MKTAQKLYSDAIKKVQGERPIGRDDIVELAINQGRKEIVAQFKKLLKSFKHCGWVNGLNHSQYEALNIAQKFIEDVTKNIKDNDNK